MEVVHIGFDIGGMSIKAGLVDKEGNTHILDYKTSVHSYSEFS